MQMKFSLHLVHMTSSRFCLSSSSIYMSYFCVNPLSRSSDNWPKTIFIKEEEDIFTKCKILRQ